MIILRKQLNIIYKNLSEVFEKGTEKSSGRLFISQIHVCVFMMCYSRFGLFELSGKEMHF